MSKGKEKKIKYNVDWEDPVLHPKVSGWIKKVSTGSRDDCFYFRCKVCMGGKLALSNMGVRAVISHMTDKKGKICKHNKNMVSIEGSKKGFFTAAVPTAPVPAPVEGNAAPIPAAVEGNFTGSSIVDTGVTTGVQKKIRLDIRRGGDKLDIVGIRYCSIPSFLK